MKYKSSIYNICFKLQNDFYIFNTFRLGLAQVSEDVYLLIQCKENQAAKIHEFSLRSPEEFAHLLDGGFIVDGEMDEAKRVWYQYTKSRFSSNTFSITIIPTYRCNLSCVYCYQSEKPDTMTQEVEKQLINFVLSELKNKEILSVTWYGGEPLLALPILYNLSQEFIKYCSKENIEYHSRLVTNGTLLDEDAISRLLDCSVEQVQITIDGPKEVHDKRRPFKGRSGQSSYQKIMCNLKYIKGKIPVCIRINIDRENKNLYAGLINDLKSKGILDRDLFVGLGHVRAWTDKIAHMRADCINMTEFSQLELDLIQDRSNKEIQENIYPNVGSICRAVSENDCIVDPSGNLLKCWIHVNNDNSQESIVGNINEGLNYNIWNLIKWLTYDPLWNNKCAECAYFPLCLGGCPYIQLYQEQRFNEICEYWTHHPIEALSIYVKNLNKLER